MTPSLSSKRELVHRNTIVRDVKKGLNMKDVTDSVEPAFEGSHRTRKHRLSGFQDNVKKELQAKPKGPSKFQAVTRISRIQSGEKMHHPPEYIFLITTNILYHLIYGGILLTLYTRCQYHHHHTSVLLNLLEAKHHTIYTFITIQQ